MSYGAIFGKTGKSGFYPTLTITPVGAVFTSVTAVSSTGQVYNATQQDSQWFIQVNDFDTYTVTGNYTGGSVNQDVDVVINQNYDVTLTVVSNTLNDNSWATIRSVADAGTGANYWAVGDAKQIDLSNKTIGTVTYGTFQPWVYILGFNHNAELEGQNMIHFGCFRSAQNYVEYNDFVLDDDYYSSSDPDSGLFRMSDNGEYNLGGWESCTMRTQIINANATSPSSASANSFLAALPNDLQAVLKQCTKYTDNVGGYDNVPANVTATQDWAFLLSEFEVQGAITYSYDIEQQYQKQYQYYINGNNKIKILQNLSYRVAEWWNRSVDANTANAFCLVDTDGSAGGSLADVSWGLAPAFCV